MHYLLLPLFLLPAFCEAAPVDVSSVGLSLVETVAAVVYVGSAVLLVYVLVESFRYVRQVMGADLSRSPIGAPDYVDFVDVETGKTSEQYRAEYLVESVAAGHVAVSGDQIHYREATIEEQASWDRISEHSEAVESLTGEQRAAYDKFAAEEDTTKEEALRWAQEVGVVRMPVLGSGWK